jgi:hypothetical protein
MGQSYEKIKEIKNRLDRAGDVRFAICHQIARRCGQSGIGMYILRLILPLLWLFF